MLIGAALGLGSWWAEAAVVVLMGVIIWRLLDEERVLAKELPGYPAYCARLRWRLLPLVW